MKILNAYAGIGGNRRLWGVRHEITAVEYNTEAATVYKQFYPMDNVLVVDAHEYILNNYDKFDIIWSSVPCQTHSRMARVNHIRYGLRQYADMKLYQEIKYLDQYFKGKYIVENVNPYYKPLIQPQKLERHCFWANFKIPYIKLDKIDNFIDAKYEDLQDWLGIEMPYKIYLNKNYDHKQVLRNCVHPKIGLAILNKAIEVIKEENIPQLDMFNNPIKI